MLLIVCISYKWCFIYCFTKYSVFGNCYKSLPRLQSSCMKMLL